jgi:Purple acid Phosphatase, N-terminal domain
MLFRLLFSFLLLALSRESWAINLVAPPEVAPAAAGEAVVRWRIDNPAGGKVRYGLSADKLDQTASDGVGTDHSVTLHGLQPGTRYFFSVGTARNPLTTGSFIAGQPGTPPAGKPVEKPSLLQKITRRITAPPEVKPTPVAKPTPAPKPIIRDAPATSRIWGNISSLQDHFNRHGGDFAAKSPDDYAAQAWRFRERAVAERLPMKLDTDGTVRVFDPKSRAFASFNRNGTAKTYFRPDSSSYWQRQPGTPIQTPPWVSQ